MAINNTQAPQNKEPSKLDTLMDAPLQATGNEISEGSHGGTLFKFGEPFELDNTKSQFFKAGDPEKRLVFEAIFGLYDTNGALTALELLLPFPEGGATNRKSKVYKTLKSLATGTKLLNEKDGSFSKGTTLKSFLGLPGVLAIKKNKKEFPTIESVAPKMDGVKYPTLKECESITIESRDLPF